MVPEWDAQRKGKQYSRSNVTVHLRSDGERGAYAARPFNPGDFVCKYAACVKKTKESKEEDSMHQTLGIRCCCLDAVYRGEKITFDATTTINESVRHIKLASKIKICNLCSQFLLLAKSELVL